MIVTAAVSGNGIKLPRSSSASEVETLDPKKTIVPNVVGMTSDEAEKELHEKSLGYVYDMERVYSDQYPADYIVAQSEEDGKVLEKNTTITLTVSKGPEKFPVPENIEGSKLSQATSELERVGLKWEISYEYSSKEIGTVLSCSPGDHIFLRI